MAVLVLGSRDPTIAPRLREAVAAQAALGSVEDGQAIASAICPNGAEALLANADPPNAFSQVLMWWGRQHPEASGFATREAWVEQEPDNAQAERLWGMAPCEDRRYAEARAPLDRAVALDPSSPECHLALGDLWNDVGAAAKAGLEYSLAAKRRPDWPPSLLGLGRVSLDLDLVAAAVGYYERATKADPKSAEAWIGLGRADLQTRTRYGASLAAFQRAVQLSPGQTDFFDDYAQTLIYTGHPDDAEALLRRREALASGDGQCHELVAELLLDNRPSAQRQALADRELRIALQCDPHMASAEIALSQILLEKGELQQAVPLIADALDSEPYNVEALTTAGRAYQMGGMRQKAAAIFALATRVSAENQRMEFLEDEEHRSPLSIQIHSELASIFLRRGQIAQARYEEETANALKTRPMLAAKGLSTLNTAAN